MRPVTLKRRQVSSIFKVQSLRRLTDGADDVRDTYRRAQGEELVVDGLRDGTNLVGEE